jgi:2-C-methyl-D-erythritol 4-phosphate cytidylyltransferase / 2-C-methyl-D-erythritol 2,4-cyclodiphosphate synthase
MASCYALIVAAGRGSRFGGALPKQYIDLDGQTVLRRAVSAFADHPRIDGVRVVIREEDRAVYDDSVAGLDLLEPVAGADTRQGSVKQGLESFAAEPPETVLIHDGARPFVSAAMIDRLLEALNTNAGAIPVLAIVDTVKRSLIDTQLIDTTIDRHRLWRAQTPQAFSYGAILEAHRRAEGHELTDDAAVGEYAGLAVALVEGEEDNMKITTEADRSRAEAILERGSEIRTGFGFDVHRFTDGDEVILFGVAVPHSARLDGHSDADVGLHAITDAILGAIGAGDIGQHFPPSDPRWKGADSAAFLAHAGQLTTQAGGTIVNIDATAICERPKIGPHREAMTARVAEILDLDPARVNIKATTTERLGFTGRQEGIAAQAVATVRLAL